MDQDTIQCPFDFYAAARAEQPVYRLPNKILPDKDVWLVSSYPLVQAVLKDYKTFSNRFGHLMGKAVDDPEIDAITAQGFPAVDTMLTQDPPAQRHYRALVNKAFSLGRIRDMGPSIEALCDELIDRFIDRGECDFFRDFAIPLPIYVIADQLGVAREDLPRFKRWSDHIIASLGRVKGRQALIEASRSIVEMHHHFAGLVEQRRAEPRDDIISDLANAKFEGKRLLEMPEILSILQQLLVAGNETTTNALAGGLVYVIEQPGMADRLAASPDLIPNAVEEILRLEAPTKHMWRIVAQDTELGGVPLAAGTVLLLSYDAANRDETLFADGDHCQFDRANAGDHLSFGGGIHFCVGAQLARREMVTAYERLFARIENIRLAQDAAPLHYIESILHRGLDGLTIRFDRRNH